MKGRRERLPLRRRSLLWVYPVGIALLLALPGEVVRTPADGGWYMSAALNLVEGRGYVDTDWAPIVQRGPLFAAWLGLFFRVFGANIETAFVAARILYVGGIILVYTVGAALFHPWAGLWAALLVATSTSLSEWSTLIHLDHVLPALILLYLWTVWLAFKREHLGLFIVAGGILGLAYWLKEMALLFLPLPLLVWMGIPQWRTRTNALGSWAAMGFSLLSILPWWIYAYAIAGRWTIFGGGAGPETAASVVETIRSQGLPALVAALDGYYSDIMASNFGFAPLLLLGWGITAVWALRGGTSERMLVSAALCFSPMMLFQGLEGWRARQSMIFLLLSYLALAGAIWKLWAAWASRRSTRSGLSTLALGSLTFFLVSGQILAEGGQWMAFARQHNAVAFLARGGWAETEIRGWHREETRQLGRWLRENLPLGTPILSDWQFKTAIYFFSGGKYPLYPMPRLCSRNFAPMMCTHTASGDQQPKVLFLWPDTGARVRSLLQYDLVALTEEDLFQALKRTNAQYVIVTLRTNFETLYFERNPSFQRVAEFGQGMFKVYRVLYPLQPVDFPTHIGDKTTSYLQLLQAEAPGRYRALLEGFLQGELDWSTQQTARLLRGDFPTVQLQKRY